ncbi:PepSY domain-containing protein [Spirosoma sp. HMF4905]|uniref:PepSY domain-containing protein n=1 Tax=Spirosoma arboris TaxID=2682092 RepID=A0A7K1SJX5_9BACT|nr:PepSY-associated TM helix domain-containing protein [Spirosoma arboris]MVM34109.1 PepSY domain-containing protein [Spirosoma arboris]
MILKKINAWLHLWLGLASGIVVFVVAVTGCILVFEQELKPLTQPWQNAERPAETIYLPPSMIQQKMKAVFPDKKTLSLWYQGHGRTVKVTLDSDSTVFVNPYTGAVAGIVDEEDFFRFVLEGHTSLWIDGEVGQHIVAWATLIFFVLLITGLILWWPKKWNKSTRDKSFKIKWKAKFKRVNYDLHNVLGFYSLIVALVITLTGLIMGFAWINKGVYWLASGGESPAPYRRGEYVSDTMQMPTRSRLASVDLAFKKGMDELAVYNKDVIIVSLPQKPTDAIYVCTDMDKGSWRDIYLDQYTLKQLPSTVIQIDQLNFADWLRRTNYAIHVGAIGNMPTKIIYFIASLICASLPITGFYVWWGRRGFGRRKKAKSASRNHSVRYEV